MARPRRYRRDVAIAVSPEALAVYRTLQGMDLAALEAWCRLTYEDWGPRGLSVREYQDLWGYAEARLMALVYRKDGNGRMALVNQRSAGVHARTLNRWVVLPCQAEEQDGTDRQTP